MATIVNTPSTTDSNSGIGFVLGTLLLLFAVFLFFYYGLPALRNAAVSTPSAPSVTVPDEIDVNVNNPGGQTPDQPAQ